MTLSSQHSPSAADILRTAQRLVIKIGSSLLIGGEDGHPALDVSALCQDIATYQGQGKQICIVSSGAVALGRRILPGRGNELSDRQALSAIGQIHLLSLWQNHLNAVGLNAAQVLLTPDITERRTRYLNARSTLRHLLEAGIVPIINENDTVAVDELRYGDNDRLAAMTAGIMDADALLLLTDVDGIYTDNPSKNKKATHIAHLSPQTLADLDTSLMETGSHVGTGGMASKIEAGRLATSWGIPTMISSGHTAHPLVKIIAGEAKATLLSASPARTKARRRWLTGLLDQDRPIIHVDQGAATALKEGKSLLKVGVTKVERPFDVGDVVAVLCEGTPIGFGLAKTSSPMVTEGSAKIIIHRDDFVVEA
ncbi:MAG: glutamate 5-kinase [Pseudomonadota bacterium]